MNKLIREKIAGEIYQMPVVNCHEHAWWSFDAKHSMEFDLGYYLYKGYLAGDLKAAGLVMEEKLFDYLSDPEAQDNTELIWTTMRPYIEKVRNCCYFRYLLRSLRDLFEVSEEDIFSDRWQLVSDKIRRYSRRNKGNGEAICRRMGVVATIMDANLGPAKLPCITVENHHMVHIARMDMFIHETRGLADTLNNYPAKNFQQWLDAFDEVFHKSLEMRAAGFKSGLAYNRRIEYADPPEERAAKIFERGILEATEEEKIIYQDFLMNRLCRLCQQANVPLQIHTGLHAGTGNTLENSKPTLLTSLFQRFDDLRFDLFHGGYPWYMEFGLMAKYFPNVYANGCWMAHVSPSVYRRALTNWIEVLPANKIFAWGGDSVFIEHAYASLSLARDLIVDVLTDFVSRNYFDIESALHLGRQILYDNGMDFWDIDPVAASTVS